MHIDHDPNENPQWVAWNKQKASFEKDYGGGNRLTPADLFRVLAPIAAVTVSLFLWRNGWPF